MKYYGDKIKVAGVYLLGHRNMWNLLIPKYIEKLKNLDEQKKTDKDFENTNKKKPFKKRAFYKKKSYKKSV